MGTGRDAELRHGRNRAGQKISEVKKKRKWAGQVMSGAFIGRFRKWNPGTWKGGIRYH